LECLITVAGNGEPTLHLAFAPIADGLFVARNRLAPNATLTLLSNGSMPHRLEVLNTSDESTPA
jgi:wyosine [tRNA(Phe)-imidazoG37] synthetase (radical SAM superfamily)